MFQSIRSRSARVAAECWRFEYYNNGDVPFRNNLVGASNSELYAYDSNNRLTSFQRGTLNSGHNAIVGTPSVNETWSLDALGNWAELNVTRTFIHRLTLSRPLSPARARAPRDRRERHTAVVLYYGSRHLYLALRTRILKIPTYCKHTRPYCKYYNNPVRQIRIFGRTRTKSMRRFGVSCWKMA